MSGDFGLPVWLFVCLLPMNDDDDDDDDAGGLNFPDLHLVTQSDTPIPSNVFTPHPFLLGGYLQIGT